MTRPDSRDYIIRNGDFYFQGWSVVESETEVSPAPILTNDRSLAHRTDHEAAQIILTMLACGNVGGVVEPAEQSESPGSPGQSWPDLN